MANNMNLSDPKTKALMGEVAGKLGISEAELRDKLQKKDLEGLLGKDGASKVGKVLSDKNLTQRILQSKEAMSIMKKLSKE